MKLLSIKNNKIKYIGLGFIFLSFAFLNAELLHAQTQPGLTDYEVLAPLPGIGDTGAGVSTLNTYLPAAFNLAVGIAIALAFVFITIGGVMYATTDAIGQKQSGKDYIENAIYGLLLVIGSYVILYTINPQLLNFSIIFPRPSPATASSTITVGRPLTQTELASDQAIRQRLNGAGIGINNGPCTAGQTQGCTNVNGLPENAITGLYSLRNSCSCDVTITGGTEGGHRTHGPGQAIVDLRPTTGINRYIWNSVNNPSDGYTRSMTMPNGQRITFTYETAGGNAGGTSTGNHWHATIN